MKIGVLKKGDRIPRVVWGAVAPMAKVLHIVEGRIAIDDDGFPVIADDVLAAKFAEVEKAMGAGA